MTKYRILYPLLLFLLSSMLLPAQEADNAPAALPDPLEEMNEEQLNEEIEAKLQQYLADISELLADVSECPPDSLLSKEQAYQKTVARWNTYYQAHQANIAKDDNLIELVAQYQALSVSTKEAIDKLGAQADSENNFFKAQDFIMQQVNVYEKMYKEARALSLSAKLAPKLDKLKTKEQVLFAEIDANYQQARQAADLSPALSKQMKALEEKYLEIKSHSDKIKAAVYKPFIQRIKDKLLITAAVAIILMFVSMIVSKLQAIKKAREMAKKYQSQFQNNNDYPTI